MRINGFTRGELYGSYVYFIFARELLYIGESQKIAFTRWHSHLYSSGNLSKKIVEFGDPEIKYSKYLNFISVDCHEIREQFPEVRWKSITRAVEHNLHLNLFISQKEMIRCYYQKYEPKVERFKIVSDTSRTAPSSLEPQFWEFANDYAKKILEYVYNYL
jgi:hypothetical protein